MNATCYHVRGYPLVEQMRVEVAAGALGDVTFVHGRYLCDDVLFPASGWRIDPARSGPSYVVGDLGTHWLDLAEHVTGSHVRRGAGGVPLVRRRPARGLRRAAAALRRRRRRLARPLGGRCRPQEPAALRVRRDEGRLHAGTRSCRPSCSSARRTAPKQIVVKDPATNAESARRLSRYPAGHGEGYGEAFRNLFADVYAAIAGQPHGPFPTFRDGAARRRRRRGGGAERPQRRLGRGRALGAYAPCSASRARRTRQRQREGERDQRQRRREQQRRERVHLGRDPELDLRVDVDRQRVVRRRSGTA